MFERYTEHARRVIFNARFEATRCGATTIEPRHLLVGVLTERSRELLQVLSEAVVKALLAELTAAQAAQRSISTNIDVPLSRESMLILTFASENATERNDLHIGIEHFFFALTRRDTETGRWLEEHGVSADTAWPQPAQRTVSRDHLHALVDSLPDGAVTHAENTLRHLQVWPPVRPPMPPRMEEVQRTMERRMTRPGTSRSGGHSGSWTASGRGGVPTGHFSSTSRSADGASVIETHHFHGDHEIEVIERLRASDDGKTVDYSVEVSDSKQKHNLEVAFKLE